MLLLTKFSFWQEDWAPDYHSMRFRHFPDISYFLRSLSRSVSREATRICHLSVIIAHHFTCSEKKICYNIKESQNIMKVVVGVK